MRMLYFLSLLFLFGVLVEWTTGNFGDPVSLGLIGTNLSPPTATCDKTTISYQGQAKECDNALTKTAYLTDGNPDTVWISKPTLDTFTLKFKFAKCMATIDLKTDLPTGDITMEAKVVDTTNTWEKIFVWSRNCSNYEHDILLPYCKSYQSMSDSVLSTDFFPTRLEKRSFLTVGQHVSWISSIVTKGLITNHVRLTFTGFPSNATVDSEKYTAIGELTFDGWPDFDDICNCQPAGIADAAVPCDLYNKCACRRSSNHVLGQKQCVPYVSQTVPSTSHYGPVSGGTLIVLYGGFFIGSALNDTNIVISGTTAAFQTRFRNDTALIALSIQMPSYLTTNKAYPLELHVGDTFVKAIGATFSYKDDPILNNIVPLHSFLKGGIIQTVHGTNMDSVFLPVMYLNLKFGAVNKTAKTLCKVTDPFTWRCPSPDLHSVDLSHLKPHIGENGDKGELNNDQYQFFVTFFIDGMDKYLDRQNLYKGGVIKIYDDPDIYNFPDKTLDYHKYRGVSSITVKGKRLNFGCSEDDYSIHIGAGECKVILLEEKKLVCSPGDVIPGLGPYSKDGKHRFNISVGDIQVVPGYINFMESIWEYKVFQYSIFGGIGGIVLITLIIIGVCILKRQWKVKEDDIFPEVSGHVDHGLIAPQFLQEEQISGQRPIADYDRYSRQPGFIDLLSAISENLRAKLQNSKRLIDHDRLELKGEIGKGQYGKVYEGILKADIRYHVAIKTMKHDVATFENMVKFLEEATMMLDFNHKHILPLLGVSINKNKPFVVLPYMENGDLKQFVSNPKNKFLVKDLIDLVHQVAEGMKYLSDLRFIHRDLAARNCMVNKDEVVKIADFGLARDIYDKDYYKSGAGDPLPIKWLAIEVLEGHGHSTQSDVWSYGVLVWEVLTRGYKPYADISNDQLLDYIGLQGRRLDKPQGTPDPIWDLLLRCWHPDPRERPAFNQIVKELDSTLAVVRSPDYINVDSQSGIISYSSNQPHAHIR